MPIRIKVCLQRLIEFNRQRMAWPWKILSHTRSLIADTVYRGMMNKWSSTWLLGPCVYASLDTVCPQVVPLFQLAWKGKWIQDQARHFSLLLPSFSVQNRVRCWWQTISPGEHEVMCQSFRFRNRYGGKSSAGHGSAYPASQSLDRHIMTHSRNQKEVQN